MLCSHLRRLCVQPRFCVPKKCRLATITYTVVVQTDHDLLHMPKLLPTVLDESIHEALNRQDICAVMHFEVFVEAIGVNAANHGQTRPTV